MALTEKQIKTIQPEEKIRRYTDSRGLYLEVSPKGGKWWRLKYQFDGKEKRISLGVYPAISLKDARGAAYAAKELLRKGIDPSAAKRTPAPEPTLSFQCVAEEWFQKQLGLWTDAHTAKVKSRLTEKVYPAFGGMPVTEVSPGVVLSFCRQIEDSISPYMAHAMHGLVSRIFRFAVACGYVQSDPCRDLLGALAPHKETKNACHHKPRESRGAGCKN